MYARIATWLFPQRGAAYSMRLSAWSGIGRGRIDGLGQVMIEAGQLRHTLVSVLAPSGDGNIRWRAPAFTEKQGGEPWDHCSRVSRRSIAPRCRLNDPKPSPRNVCRPPHLSAVTLTRRRGPCELLFLWSGWVSGESPGAASSSSSRWPWPSHSSASCRGRKPAWITPSPSPRGCALRRPGRFRRRAPAPRVRRAAKTIPG